ncbi:hypothetical protein [Maritimibacter alexandrii]|uniref:hypothetical protein n=1 Tax=Maritimibacter alexandrii TaxID=2570355 RepID=UPI00110A0356|nr:hypothetical protein [Maritimibacter alexandrii]
MQTQTQIPPRGRFDAIRILANPSAHTPTLLQLARLTLATAAGAPQIQSARHCLKAPGVKAQLTVIPGGRAET